MLHSHNSLKKSQRKVNKREIYCISTGFHISKRSSSLTCQASATDGLEAVLHAAANWDQVTTLFQPTASHTHGQSVIQFSSQNKASCPIVIPCFYNCSHLHPVSPLTCPSRFLFLFSSTENICIVHHTKPGIHNKSAFAHFPPIFNFIFSSRCP